MAEYPFTTKPEDITRLLQLIPTIPIPEGDVDASYVKSLGYSASSSSHLHNILKSLGFINDKNEATEVWKAYSTDEHRGLILATAIKSAYPKLFSLVFCPYLESDEVMLDFLKQEGVKRSSRDLSLTLDTFRSLCDLADFQGIMSEEGTVASDEEKNQKSEIKVNPNLQMNIEIHIAPDTPEEKIESIFKNMRKYLLGKED